MDSWLPNHQEKSAAKKISQCNCSRHSSFFLDFQYLGTFSLCLGNFLTWRVWIFQCRNHEAAFPASFAARAQSCDLDVIISNRMMLWIGKRRRHDAGILVRVVVAARSWPGVAWQMFRSQHSAATEMSPRKEFYGVIWMLLLCWLYVLTRDSVIWNNSFVVVIVVVLN